MPWTMPSVTILMIQPSACELCLGQMTQELAMTGFQSEAIGVVLAGALSIECTQTLALTI